MESIVWGIELEMYEYLKMKETDRILSVRMFWWSFGFAVYEVTPHVEEEHSQEEEGEEDCWEVFQGLNWLSPQVGQPSDKRLKKEKKGIT